MPHFILFRSLALGTALALTLPIAANAAGPMAPVSHPGGTAAAAPDTAPAASAAAASPAAPAAGAPSPASMTSAAAQPAPAPSAGAPPDGAPSTIAVSAWGFSQTSPSATGGPALASATAHRPLYLWMTLAGGQGAVDRLRGGQHLAVAVHWTNDSPGSADRALTKELDIANPGLAATLQGEIAKDGHFTWHSWARKDVLSPGRWTVTLTTPDGQPILCGQPAQEACRLSIDVS